MDTYLVISVLQFFEGDGVVKIFCICRVDREGGSRSEVMALSNLFSRDGVRNRIGCVLDCLRELQWETKVSQDGVHLGVVLAFFTKNAFYYPDRVLGILWPFQNGH